MRTFPCTGNPHLPLSRNAARGLIGLAIFSLALCNADCHKGEVSSTEDALRLILKYDKQGRPDEAAKAALGWLRVEPHDVNVQATVALIYLEKAESDKAHCNGLVDEALQHTNSALQLAPDALGAISPGAFAFERAGDVSTAGRCDRYEKALELIDREISIETEDSKERSGTPGAQWEQIIRLSKTKQARIKEKMLNAGCK